jgi:hypothetical protein
MASNEDNAGGIPRTEREGQIILGKKQKPGTNKRCLDKKATLTLPKRFI